MNPRKVNIDSIIEDIMKIKHPIFGAPFLSQLEVDTQVYFPKKEDNSYFWVQVAHLFEIDTQKIEKVIAVDGIQFDILSPIIYMVIKMPHEYLYIKAEFDNNNFPDLIESTEHNHAYLSTHSSLEDVLNTIKTDKVFYDYLFEQNEYNLREEITYTSGLTILNALAEVEYLENVMTDNKQKPALIKL